MPKLRRSAGMAIRALPTLLSGECQPVLLSLDIFDTLLQRPPSAEAHWLRLWAEQAGKDLELSSGRLLLARKQAWKPAIRASGSKRPDPEPSHRALMAETLRLSAGILQPPEELLAKLEGMELDAITSLTRADPSAVDLILRAQEVGLKVVIASDMYLSAASINNLLQRHGLKGFSHIYVSSEDGRTKFSGRLFDHLLEQEGVPGSQVLHVGDHPWSDAIAPASRGIRTRWIGPPTTPRSIRSGVLSRSLGGKSMDSARNLGRRVLGPALTGALPLLRERLDTLAPELVLYVARDGELLSRLMEVAGLQPAYPVAYALLSRRSTLAASLETLEPDTAIELLTLRRSNRGLRTLFGGLGMEADSFAFDASAAGFHTLEEPIANPVRDPRLRRLLKSTAFQERFSTEAALQRQLLRGYLTSLGYFDARRVVLIDLGWRGSIQDALGRAFISDPAAPELHGLYLGLWDDGLVGTPRSLNRRHGVLSDRNRGSHLLEAALPEIGLALEPVFRARHGTVLGYRQEGGVVRAVLEETTGQTRSFEREAELLSDRIRAGLLEFTRSEAGFLTSAKPRKIRLWAQLRLARLAYFSSQAERKLLGALPFTEGADSAWALPVILEQSAETGGGPANRLRRWAAGLESPWRAGYVAETLGRSGSLAYVLAQVVWLAIPSPWKRTLRHTIQRQVYAPPDTDEGTSRSPFETP